MADLILDVDFSKVSRAIDELSRLGKLSADTNKGMAQATRLVVQWQEKFAAQQGRVNAEIQKGIIQQNLANKSARDSAAAFEAYDRRIEQLTMKYKPLYAASMQYENALNEINEAHKHNILSVEQHAEAVDRLNTEYAQFQNGTAGWENQFVSGSTRAGKSMNRFGMYAQQVGYQVGDFLVQVQSGQSVLVAFGQQATQLAGLIPGVWGAVAGIGISLGTAIGNAAMKFWEAKSGADAFAKSLEKAREESQDLASDLELMLSGYSDMNTLVFAKNLRKEQEKLAEAIIAVNEAGLDPEAQAILQEKRDAAQKAVDKANEELETYKRRLEFQEKEQEFLDDILGSAEGIAEANEANIEIYEKSLEKMQEIADRYVDVLGSAQGLEAAAEANRYKTIEWAKAAERLEEELGYGAVNALDLAGVDITKGISSAAKEAAKLAANLGISLSAAVSLMNLQSSQVYSGRGGDPRKVGTADYMKQLDYKNIDELIKEYNDKHKPKSKKGSTADSIKSGTEYIERVLKPEIELRQKNVFLSDEQQKRAKFEFDLRQKLDKYKDKASEKEIAAVMALYDQTVRLERASRLIDYAQGQMEDFFMSVVDGTSTIEDAFKGMLRNILLEIYKQQVVEPISTGISGFLKGLLGGVGGSSLAPSSSIRPPVKAFATGGIVSAPTLFPMANGAGLMGEAGPEAIMPLKRGANGKLGVEMHGGSSQQVIVNQSFNFSANGDESVKKIIAQAAPQIAQMTQQKIMDSRRRGGQMKATFS